MMERLLGRRRTADNDDDLCLSHNRKFEEVDTQCIDDVKYVTDSDELDIQMCEFHRMMTRLNYLDHDNAATQFFVKEIC